MKIYKDSTTPVLAAVSSVKVTNFVWNYVAISFSSTTLKPTFYKALVTDDALPPGEEYTGIASTFAPSCTSLTSNFIGKANNREQNNDFNLAAALNDLKIFNTSLSFDQLKANFLAEKSI